MSRPVVCGILLMGFLTMGLSGCVGPGAQQTLLDEPADIAPPRVVVATHLDTGIQPYHEVFRLEDSREAAWIHELPNVTVLGADFRGRVLEDVDAWDELELGRLYYFEGTRVLAISFWEPFAAPGLREVSQVLDNLTGQPNAHPIYDESLHGTAVASVVAQASPHAFVLMIEENSNALDGLAWVDQQPWIDIYSVSRSALVGGGNPPEKNSFAASYHKAWEEGKLVFVAAGNDPSPLFMGEQSAPWVVRVGGMDPASHGATVMSSGLPDMVSNYTHDHLADARTTTEYLEGYGTSLATPRIAATAAEAIYQLRARASHGGGIRDGALVMGEGARVTNVDVRAALNGTARYWGTGEYEPDLAGWSGRIATVALPVLPEDPTGTLGPWTQMGWGHVDEARVPDILAALLGEAPAPKPPGAVAFMEAQYALRETWWNPR